MNPKLKVILEFIDEYKDCTLCSYCLNETKVFGRGNLNAKIAIVGEGPGKEECQKGIPFVGPSGQLLEKILSAINIKRKDVYFTNAITCRTSTSNRTPSQVELNNCRSRLFKELSIIKPVVSLLVGSVALGTIFGPDYNITKYHGEWLTLLSPPCFFYFPIHHPSWILHSSTEGEKLLRKRLIWEDIKRFRDDLEVFKSTKIYNE